mmetsp:Transcript_23690/g.51728  ORF Transcript_23690/g.51728 Transcript_23690/m.51728 type:complete len:381 (-) Transcript_23690:124-1266(-)|eukprot:CAMPEP_0118945206 /NCGR_PEP_ID=MMETSP1169-20130426/41796_1 /TAXON_ID=36882 /ORGANISM="Pyramimonas obovata, Strain CCMP722" /LENGTH=380 /DNA_ID=CAMNT_0006890863 /DNA_START=111 /DNA_END=1253 /DNA_ORIENTATION=-
MSSYAPARCEAAARTPSASLFKYKSRTSAKRLFSDRRQRNAPSRATLRLSVTQASSEVPLACPVSLLPLDATGLCAASGLQYGEEDGYWNLTIGAAKNKQAAPAPASIVDLARDALPKELRGFLPKGETLGTTTFELPSVAFVYERGWRQSFAGAGFPGPDAEFEMAQEALSSAAGGIMIDASCGSGLFTRRFVQSEKYGQVVALDFSDSMLQQAITFCKEESVSLDDLTFVRADIGRIPFPTGSIDGVHAGAAIHCWPNPEAAIAEIARVLKPGATYCGTTFLNPRIPFVDDEFQRLALSVVRQTTPLLPERTGLIKYWDKQELKELFESCGLVNFDCDIRNQFIFYSAQKPAAPAQATEPEAEEGGETLEEVVPEVMN